MAKPGPGSLFKPFSWIQGAACPEPSTALSNDLGCSADAGVASKEVMWSEILRTVRRIDKRGEANVPDKRLRQLEQMTRKLHEAQTVASKREEYAVKLNKELSRATHYVNSWKERSDCVEEELRILRLELQEKEKELEKAQIDVRTVQLHALNAAHSGWKAEEDCRVCAVLEKLDADIRDWAKRYSVTSMSHAWKKTAHNAAFKYLLRDLEGIATFPDVRSLKEMKSPFLLVAAMLWDHLLSRIFGNPFFLLSALDQEKKWTLQSGRCFENVYCKLGKASPSDAAMFRTQLLRAVCPDSEFGKSTLNTDLVSRVSAESLFEEIASEFWWNDNIILLGGLEGDSAEAAQFFGELSQIVSEASAIRNHLSTQRIKYEWQSESRHLNTPFDVHSDVVRADQRNRLDDEEDERCNGKSISIVRSPLVVAYGNSDGEDYDSGRVICKAVVWVDDSADSSEEEL